MNFKNIIAFGIGAGIGSFVTYNVVTKKLTDELNDEMEVYKNHYLGVDPTCENESVPDEDVVSDKINLTDARQHEIYKKTTRKYTAYDKAGSDGPDDNDPEDDPYYKEGKKVYRENPEEPYVISLYEFSNDMPSYDKLTIYYYEQDDALADENEELIDDRDSLIGEDSLECFGQDSDDADIVFVRNDKMGIDYEVIRLPKSYKITMGIE